MPMIVRKSISTLSDARREIFRAISWQVHTNLWSPPTDVYETDEAYVVRVEIAGMREEDFEVVFENDLLMISGSRLDSPERRAYHQMEIRFGKFATAVSLPGPVDLDEAAAGYRDGFLTVAIPKSKPSQIKVE